MKRFRPKANARHSTAKAGRERTDQDAIVRLKVYEQLVDSIKDYAIFAMDPQGRIVSWNKGAQHLKGYSEDEILGQPYARFFTPEDRLNAVPHHLLQEAAEKGQVQTQGWRIRKDGSRFWADALITAMRDEHGGLVGFAKVTRDLSERRRAQLALERLESMLRSIIDSATELIYVLDREGRVVHANPTLGRMTGRPTHSLVGTRYSDWLSPESARLLAEHDHEALTADQPRRFEETICFANGITRTFSSTRFPYLSGQGGRLGVVGVCHDITERKEMEANLSRLASIVNATDDAIYSFSLDRIIETWNPGAERMFGYSAAEMLGTHGRAIVPPGEEPFVVALTARIAQGEHVPPMTAVRLRKGGIPLDVSLVYSPVFDDQGKVVRISAIARDITAIKQAEAALRESETRFKGVLEANPDPIIIVNQQGTLVMVNSQAEKVFGFSRDELLGRPVEMLMPERFREVHPAYVRGFFAAPHVRPMGAFPHPRAAGMGPEFIGLRKDGSEFPVDINLSPLETPQGPLVISVVRDITERKRAMEELALKTVELKNSKELSAMKDHFLSTLSHEMKTPLSLITGYAELLEDKYPQEELVAGLEEGSRRLCDQINTLLDYSALLSGSLPLYVTEVDLDEIVCQIREAMKPSFKLSQLELVTEVLPGVPVIEGDSRRVTQMLTELLTNARKFTPPGGRVGIRIAPRNDSVKIEVWDTGPGIPPQDRERIWEAFMQLETGDSRQHGGLGLGLTIVKKLVDLHNGRIEVGGELGKGTTITIYLPRQAPKSQPQLKITSYSEAGQLLPKPDSPRQASR